MEKLDSKLSASHDPLKEERYFVLAVPVPELEKESTDKRKAPDGTFAEETDFGGAHCKIFDRLGLDLLQVTSDGKAVVHADKLTFSQLSNRAARLPTLGVREQARWATIDSFDLPQPSLRVDDEWLHSLPQSELSDVIVELQPILRRREADEVMRAILALMNREGETLTANGADFSGRRWVRGRFTRASVRAVAKDFYSVQSLHAPLYSLAAAQRGTRATVTTGRSGQHPVVAADLPCVAVVDMGVPDSHIILSPYRRGQFYGQSVARQAIGNHGSLVASRVVFGDHSSHESIAGATPACSFYDAMIGSVPHFGNTFHDKAVIDALSGVRGAAPDVRVFNLSIGDHKTFSDFNETDLREKRLTLQDLDNFAFANDCVLVVAAGNSVPGTAPAPPYPEHLKDSRWALGPWASGFNTWICGSYVSRITSGGLVVHSGWPSAFTRIGPGLCNCPTPNFGAPGGNCDDAYRVGNNGHGVWGIAANGLGEDHCGSSHAAPILAREVAFTLRELQRYCVQGTTPFAVTAKAFLSLTATRTTEDAEVRELAGWTLGRGKASVQRLRSPATGSAVILWQGYIESSKDTVRVQLPIPKQWLASAEKPVLRLIVCSDPPVNEAAKNDWACRKTVARLHPSPDAKAVRAPRGGHYSYPLIDRTYDLQRHKPGESEEAPEDLWVLELSYEEIAPYVAAVEFDPRQRVAFAAELLDLSENPVDPQPMMQALPIAASMTRLSVTATPIRPPVIVRTL
ncbi:S8 family serine peptidase [Caulifigura coniformis]|nr:S8 family serine peptidase [Caulifigura coniformis]